jgi:hypothetical protein
MRHPLIEEVRAYWEALRADGAIPLRAQVDPRGIERALEHTMILERIAPGIARVRLAGMALADLMAMEVRGMPLSALFAPQARARLAERLEPVFDGPAALEVAVAGEPGFGRPPLSGVMLVLPLRSNAGRVDRALACMAMEGAIGRTPRRLDILGSTLSRITAGATPAGIAAVHGPAVPVPAAPGLAEPPAPPPRPAGRPALRLVRSDG